MSTLVFLRAQDPSMSEEQAVDMTRKLKPKFSKEEISKGRRIFAIMKDFLDNQRKQPAMAMKHSRNPSLAVAE
jgi:hypothetical protein